MSLSRILNKDNALPRSTAFSQQHPIQLSSHHRDDSDGDEERASKRRRTSDDVSQQHERRWQSPPAPSSDLDECPEIWQDELNKYMLETRIRARQVQHWFEEKCRERNAAVARYAAHDYSARIASLADRLPPATHRPHSTSIEQDILFTLHDTSPPSNGHPHLSEDVGFSDALPHRSARGKGKWRADSDIDSVMVKTELDGLLSSRKRKLDDAEDLISDAPSSIVLPAKKKAGRQKYAPTGEDGLKQPRKRGPRKPKATIATSAGSKLPSEEPQQLHLQPPPNYQPTRLSPSIAGSVCFSLDASPIPSTPSSPTLTAVPGGGYGLGFWPIDEPVPPPKRPKKIDHTQAAKRVVALEESQRRVWLSIARKDVVRAYKYHANGYMVKSNHHKRLASMAASQARKSSTRTTKSTKDTQTRAKRIMREMLVFWKKNEREERDVRKRAEKEAVDRAKEEEERREAARQARKLEFLISQTELYSHFVGNKLKTVEAEQLTGERTKDVTAGSSDLPLGANEAITVPLDELDFDDEDQTNLHRHAARNAQDAIALARERAQAFDVQAAIDRRANEALSRSKSAMPVRDEDKEGCSETPDPATSALIVDLDSDELNFQNPTSLKEMTVAQPRMLMAQLKEYQLKGLNWLATLYEQGINGILADEMGLGKTVQSISLLAYLAETHDIWGPFLVIAPASTLHNWQQEISRFVPGLKALPYWGNVKDRATLRKFWNKKQISYNQDAPFHVLITSYPLVVQDDKYFQRVKWQYMILDEAQAIKSSSSARWKTLLNFQCRNRLLLTGTPVQNSMQELWALLHFIMPSLFDSHDEFSEWFSKDIENAAENKGSKLNEHQLRRLHMILKPFMLRRVKRHVQNELSDKIELDIYCDLSPRQRALYRGLRANISVAELLQKAANIGDADSAMSLMNLVMQFRKVCNHPELFERSDVVAPFSFCRFGHSRSLVREGELLECPYSAQNPIEFTLPALLFLDGGLLDVPGENSRLGSYVYWLENVMSIWSTNSIHRSFGQSGSAFSFLYPLKMSPNEAHVAFKSSLIKRMLHTVHKERHRLGHADICSDNEFVAQSVEPMGVIQKQISSHFEIAEGFPALNTIGSTFMFTSYLSRPEIRWRSEAVSAPPIMIQCTSRTFVDRASNILSSPLTSLALYGLPASHASSSSSVTQLYRLLPNIHPLGLLRSSPRYQIPWSPMQVPEGKRLVYDSTKLARLDILLQELKAGDHRVLIYFQMTKMMDLMEEYLVFRQYKYLRLDGSSKLEDRRDMVLDWQTRPDIFIFLLSTRAGGLGINLTAADTVIFYDHDWNPSNDAQAMDRAHRLGQTRQVTVYRLITRGTIDERIVQLARVKKDVQDIVVGNKQFTEATKPSEIVSLLLNDEELANLGNAPSAVDASASGTNICEKRTGKQPMSGDVDGPTSVRDFWNEEGDDFFGHPNPPPPPSVGMDAEDDMTPPPAEIVVAKKKGKGTGAKRGRKRK